MLNRNDWGGGLCKVFIWKKLGYVIWQGWSGGLSNVLFADDIEVDISRVIGQAAQLLPHLLHLLLVPQTLEDVQRPPQVNSCVAYLQADVDRPQQFECAGQLQGLPEDLLLELGDL